MILYINRETNEIVSEVYVSPRPEEENSLSQLAQNIEIVEQPDPPVQAFLITDEQLIAKYFEAMDKWAVLKPVYDVTGETLIDLEILEPDYGWEK